MARPMSKARQQELWDQQRAYFEERKLWFAINYDRKRVEAGDEIKDFRGKVWIYDGIDSFPVAGKSGRVRVIDPEVAEGEHCRKREFYPSVFNLDLEREAAA